MVLPGQLGGRVGRRRVIFEKAVRFRRAGQPFSTELINNLAR